ncbi:hypothetical protein M569_12310 [Genlisea aurea]|uniref:Uncharacterized protein n=1 Tax=Genlisea aurea TaxID=192259 RepID=S8DI88_9LAMI|nr:hypothetical protein M569_12310 [Genlisea aurea]
MDSISVVSPARRRFRWACTRCLGRRSLTGEIYPEKNPDNRDSETQVDDRKLKEAFFAGIFAGVSTIKAAYADLQLSHSPYDPDGIQSSDKIIVSELKKLSRIRIDYDDNKKTIIPAADSHESESSLLRFEIQERKNLLKIYETTIKKLDYQLKLKQSEIIFLREKLSEARIENRGLEKRLLASSAPSSESISEIGGFHGLRLDHFGCFHRRTINSVRKFVRVLIDLMDSAGWDFSAAAESILHRRIPFRKQSHLFLAIESFVSRVMFDGFNDSDFLVLTRRRRKKKRRTRKRLFSKFLRMKQRNPFDYVSGRPDSSFASFCRSKYLKLVHPKMEESLGFAHSKQRERVAAGKFPETPFLTAFVEMAKGVWLLHCLGRCFDPEISIFQASRGNRMAEVFMEGLGGDEAAFPGDRRVGFTVSPGFTAAGTVVQCQVYIC